MPIPPEEPGPEHYSLTPKQKARFDENGFLHIFGPSVEQFREGLQTHLLETAHKVLPYFEETRQRLDKLKSLSFPELIDWVVKNEKEQRVSRAFYEIFPARHETVGISGHSLLHGIARELGLEDPVPSTLPLIRIDRPGDTRFKTPAHQDYWFSLLSEEALVFWMPLKPLEREMGLLEAVPGSHRAGLIPFRVYEEGHEPYTTREVYPDDSYEEIPVKDTEVLVFSQLLLHRSGMNRSQKARVSLQVRLHDMAQFQVPTATFTPKHSWYVKERQEDLLEAFQKSD